MKTKLATFFRRASLASMSVLAPVLASAQAKDAKTILDGATTQLNQMAGTVINLISVIGALAAVAMLAPNLLKYLKGDPSSNDALIKVGAGIIIFVIILQVIRMTMLNGA